MWYLWWSEFCCWGDCRSEVRRVFSVNYKFKLCSILLFYARGMYRLSRNQTNFGLLFYHRVTFCRCLVLHNGHRYRKKKKKNRTLMPAGSYLFFPKLITLSFIWNGFSVKASLKFEAAIIVLHKGILMKEFAITKNGPWQIILLIISLNRSHPRWGVSLPR